MSPKKRPFRVDETIVVLKLAKSSGWPGAVRAGVPDQPGSAWRGPAWPVLAGFPKSFEGMAKKSSFYQGRVGLSFFMGRDKNSFYRRGAHVNFAGHFPGCGWASRAGVIHGRCEDGVLKVFVSRR